MQDDAKPTVPYWHLWTDSEGVSHQSRCLHEDGTLIVSASRNGAAAPNSAFRIALGNSMARVMPRSVRTSTTSY
jgi:hypothetical protein